MDDQPGETVYTVEQVAVLLRVKPTTVLRHLRSGELVGRKMGGRAGWRVTHSRLLEWLRGEEKDAH
jgi:excisionase family DNA binding protein